MNGRRTGVAGINARIGATGAAAGEAGMPQIAAANAEAGGSWRGRIGRWGRSAKLNFGGNCWWHEARWGKVWMAEQACRKLPQEFGGLGIWGEAAKAGDRWCLGAWTVCGHRGAVRMGCAGWAPGRRGGHGLISHDSPRGVMRQGADVVRCGQLRTGVCGGWHRLGWGMGMGAAVAKGRARGVRYRRAWWRWPGMAQMMVAQKEHDCEQARRTLGAI